MDKRAKPTIVAHRIREVVGDRTLDEFARDWEAKTGTRLDRSTFQKWMAGERLPRVSNLFALAEYSGRPAGWFLMTDEEIAGLCGTSPASLRTALDQEVERILKELPLATYSSRRRPLSDRDKLMILALEHFLKE